MDAFARLRGLPPETVLAATRGDRPATEAVTEASYHAIRHVMLRLSRGGGDLEDLLQNALTHMIAGLKSYRPDGSFAGWVTKICVNVVRDHVRRDKTRAVVVSVSDTDEVKAVHGDGGCAHDHFARRERLRHCQRALDHLNPDQRTAFVLRFVYGYSVREIAQMTGSMQSTTRLRLYYGRKSFSRALASETRGDESAVAAPRVVAL